MIKTPTVFIVGAGASVLYQLPTAREIAAELAQKQGHRFTMPVGFWNRDDDYLLSKFADDVTESGLHSIDLFLEKHPDQRVFGQRIIAGRLGISLATRASIPPPGNADWLRYLFNHVVAGPCSWTDFVQASFFFVTFNFDQLIEERLTKFASKVWRLEPALVRPEINKKVIHVHGSFRSPRNSDDLSQQWLNDAAGRIQIVHDQIDPALLETVQTTIAASKVVCFLGFSFDRRNVEKLGGPAVLHHGAYDQVFGSALGMSKNECDMAIVRCGGRTLLADVDCIGALRQFPVLLEE